MFFRCWFRGISFGYDFVAISFLKTWDPFPQMLIFHFSHPYISYFHHFTVRSKYMDFFFCYHFQTFQPFFPSQTHPNNPSLVLFLALTFFPLIFFLSLFASLFFPLTIVVYIIIVYKTSFYLFQVSFCSGPSHRIIFVSIWLEKLYMSSRRPRDIVEIQFYSDESVAKKKRFLESKWVFFLHPFAHELINFMHIN